jgi:hypothetical protein
MNFESLLLLQKIQRINDNSGRRGEGKQGKPVYNVACYEICFAALYDFISASSHKKFGFSYYVLVNLRRARQSLGTRARAKCSQLIFPLTPALVCYQIMHQYIYINNDL